MTDRLDDAELDRLEAVLERGPKGKMDWGEVLINGNPSDGPDAIAVWGPDANRWAVMDYDGPSARAADLITSACNALPALLDEVRAHRAREAERQAAQQAEKQADRDLAAVRHNALRAEMREREAMRLEEEEEP